MDKLIRNTTYLNKYLKSTYISDHTANQVEMRLIDTMINSKIKVKISLLYEIIIYMFYDSNFDLHELNKINDRLINLLHFLFKTTKIKVDSVIKRLSELVFIFEDSLYYLDPRLRLINNNGIFTYSSYSNSIVKQAIMNTNFFYKIWLLNNNAKDYFLYNYCNEYLIKLKRSKKERLYVDFIRKSRICLRKNYSKTVSNNSKSNGTDVASFQSKYLKAKGKRNTFYAGLLVDMNRFDPIKEIASGVIAFGNFTSITRQSSSMSIQFRKSNSLIKRDTTTFCYNNPSVIKATENLNCPFPENINTDGNEYVDINYNNNNNIINNALGSIPEKDTQYYFFNPNMTTATEMKSENRYNNNNNNNNNNDIEAEYNDTLNNSDFLKMITQKKDAINNYNNKSNCNNNSDNAIDNKDSEAFNELIKGDFALSKDEINNINKNVINNVNNNYLNVNKTKEVKFNSHGITINTPYQFDYTNLAQNGNSFNNKNKNNNDIGNNNSYSNPSNNIQCNKSANLTTHNNPYDTIINNDIMNSNDINANMNEVNNKNNPYFFNSIGYHNHSQQMNIRNNNSSFNNNINNINNNNSSNNNSNTQYNFNFNNAINNDYNNKLQVNNNDYVNMFNSGNVNPSNSNNFNLNSYGNNNNSNINNNNLNNDCIANDNPLDDLSFLKSVVKPNNRGSINMTTNINTKVANVNSNKNSVSFIPDSIIDKTLESLTTSRVITNNNDNNIYNNDNYINIQKSEFNINNQNINNNQYKVNADNQSNKNPSTQTTNQQIYQSVNQSVNTSLSTNQSQVYNQNNFAAVNQSYNFNFLTSYLNDTKKKPLQNQQNNQNNQNQLNNQLHNNNMNTNISSQIKEDIFKPEILKSQLRLAIIETSVMLYNKGKYETAKLRGQIALETNNNFKCSNKTFYMNVINNYWEDKNYFHLNVKENTSLIGKNKSNDNGKGINYKISCKNLNENLSVLDYNVNMKLYNALSTFSFNNKFQNNKYKLELAVINNSGIRNSVSKAEMIFKVIMKSSEYKILKSAIETYDVSNNIITIKIPNFNNKERFLVGLLFETKISDLVEVVKVSFRYMNELPSLLNAEAYCYNNGNNGINDNNYNNERIFLDTVKKSIVDISFIPN